MRVIQLAVFLLALAGSSYGTDYVYFSVNGDTARGYMVSGDTLAFGSNLSGRGIWWEVFVDMDSSGDVTGEDKCMVGFLQIDQDQWFRYGVPDGDSRAGWVRFDLGPAGVAPGYTYIALATDQDGSSAFDTMQVDRLPAAAGIISGTVSAEGLTPPDSGLAMIQVEAGLDTVGRFWNGFTDTYGAYRIEVDSGGLGILYNIGPTSELYPFVRPGRDTMILTDSLTNVDFLYELAAGLLVGSVVNERGDSLPFGVGMDANCEPAGSKSTVLHEPGRYFFPFLDSETGVWSVTPSGFGLLPFYLVPPSKQVTIALGDTARADFIVYRADTVIPGRVTIADTVPLDTFHLVFAECETSGVGVTFDLCDSATGTYALGVNSSDTLTWLVVVDPPTGNRIPGFIVEDGFARMSIAAGDSVNFNFVPATDTIGGQVSFHASVPGPLRFPLDTLGVLFACWSFPLFPFQGIAGLAAPDTAGNFEFPAEPDTYAVFCIGLPDTNYYAQPFSYDSLVIDGDTDTLRFVIYHRSIGAHEGGAAAASLQAHLSPCHPDPFSVSTRMTAFIPDSEAGRARVCVYDVAGRLVNVLSSGEKGNLVLEWSGRDLAGSPVPGGVYFIRLEMGERGVTNKAVLLR